MCVYIYIYIYIYRERERDVYLRIYLGCDPTGLGPEARRRNWYILVIDCCVYVYIYSYVYIYIYTYV